MMIRIPNRFAGILMPLVLSILMTFVVSGVASLKNLGPTPGLIAAWMSAWALSWLVAFPTLLCALPVAKRIVQAIVKPA
jgi:hypothetical protein